MHQYAGKLCVVVLQTQHRVTCAICDSECEQRTLIIIVSDWTQLTFVYVLLDIEHQRNVIVKNVIACNLLMLNVARPPPPGAGNLWIKIIVLQR